MKSFLSVPLVLLFCFGQNVGAQRMWEDLTRPGYGRDSAEVGALFLEADGLFFFHNNEYSGLLCKGYSLPGLWVQPKLTYNPVRQIHLEAGLHALIFNGANKYPCYAYHDIGTWKGNQYQSGAHLLPWFRAQAAFRQLTVVLGNLYGGQNHGLTEPLFNPELNLSQDPEMGVQLLWQRPHLQADIWLNWQSYIFRLDTHQEAFTVGMNWDIKYGKPESAIQWRTPIQLVIQHRGGEQDVTTMGAQTVSNASLGAALQWNAGHRVLKELGAEVDLLAAYQQNGHLWPFKSGLAIHTRLDFNLFGRLGLHTGYLCAPRHFITLYGNPLFNTMSQNDHTSFSGNNTVYARADYHHVIARHYVLGVQAEAFQTWLPHHHEFNYGYGIYLRVNPRLLIKKW